MFTKIHDLRHLAFFQSKTELHFEREKSTSNFPLFDISIQYSFMFVELTVDWNEISKNQFSIHLKLSYLTGILLKLLFEINQTDLHVSENMLIISRTILNKFFMNFWMRCNEASSFFPVNSFIRIQRGLANKFSYSDFRFLIFEVYQSSTFKWKTFFKTLPPRQSSYFLMIKKIGEHNKNPCFNKCF